jgi:hypothetical protein
MLKALLATNRKKPKIMVVLALFLLALLFVVFYEPSSPDGVYYWPDLACSHGVWIFKNGKIYGQCIGENAPSKIGSYIKSGNKWISESRDNISMKPSMFGITLYGSSFKNGHQFFFRDQFSWVVDCKDWCVFQLSK